ncbi:SDR family NAD(P)-dependent oxidoreductase [Microbacterium excoecariae]|uniref:SDR family NAD(P)-dependent oxidoreductase n=1 Tax=Microbacterium excoecariae TaxID=2715210 RepID=UPI00140A82D5|nr:SDR family oxidoreductase [Microbacterium excoecariae]NHI17779.1 SDR family oxidoreductase [Microbacterium excoecariae]
MSGYDGLVAIVTGGASGIGAAIARRLRGDGATVACFDVAEPPTPDDVRVDITDDAAVRAAVARVAERHGRIDVVVNNAGIGAQGTIEANSDEEWHRVLDVNLVGPVRVSRAALPWLRQSPHAAIVNMCSIAASAGLPQRALYGASKGALAALTLQMAADHVREGIRVNGVSPGTAETPWVTRLLDAAPDPQVEREALAARQPHERLVQPEEVADAVAYLAHPASASTIGTILEVDGGMSGLRLRPRQ